MTRRQSVVDEALTQVWLLSTGEAGGEPLPPGLVAEEALKTHPILWEMGYIDDEGYTDKGRERLYALGLTHPNAGAYEDFERDWPRAWAAIEKAMEELVENDDLIVQTDRHHSVGFVVASLARAGLLKR
jgi:hypothetical protein